MPLAHCADPWQNLNVAQDAEVKHYSILSHLITRSFVKNVIVYL